MFKPFPTGITTEVWERNIGTQNDELKWKEVMVQFGQAGLDLMLGVLAAATFTIKHIFVYIIAIIGGGKGGARGLKPSSF